MSDETHRRTVMIVDDDSTTRLMSRLTVENAGFDVVEVDSGEEAVKLFQKHPHDAILLDVNLPGIDGFNTCQEIRYLSNGRYTPIIMITSLDDIESIEKAYHVGATDFIIKPINWTILAHRVRHIIRAQQVEAEVKYLAYYDSLTKLPNRTLFKENLDTAIVRSSATQGHFALLFLDIDNFKKINDSLGHNYGDELLIIVAERLSQSLRKSDYVSRNDGSKINPIARLGGDEFIVLLLNESTPKEISKVAKRIIDTLSKPILLQNHEVTTSASIGIAVYPSDGIISAELMKNADTAMYHAKDKGKNIFCFYDRKMNEQALDKLELERDLQNAIKKSELLLNFQPKIDLKENKIIGVEALIRWKHPKRGFIPPNLFIPLAEETNLIIPIGDWVIQEACKTVKELHKAGFPELTMAVNLSSRQFSDSELLKKIKLALNKANLEPDKLEIELTENMIIENDVHTLEILHKIKDMGIKLSIDDFGTGYSSLRYLSKFPLNILKVDRSFIEHIPDSHDDRAISKAIVALAHSLNLMVVAEGIENEEQLNFLKENACDQVQGFLFYRPLPLDELLKALKNHS